MIARWIGAAPRQRGSSEAWILRQPYGGASRSPAAGSARRRPPPPHRRRGRRTRLEPALAKGLRMTHLKAQILGPGLDRRGPVLLAAPGGAGRLAVDGDDSWPARQSASSAGTEKSGRAHENHRISRLFLALRSSMSRFTLDRWSKYILAVQVVDLMLNGGGPEPSKSRLHRTPSSLRKAKVSPRRTRLNSGRDAGQVRAGLFVGAHDCELASTISGLAMRIARPRSSLASTTARRSITPICGAASPTPGIASIVSIMSPDAARMSSVISNRFGRLRRRLSGQASGGAHGHARACSRLSFCILRVIICRFIGPR